MAIDMGTIGKVLQGGMQFGSGLIQINQGAGLAGLGGNISAEAFRNAGVASVAAANYNSSLINLNAQRQMNALSYEIQKFSSAQIAQTAVSGADPKSKSFLLVMSESMSVFENMVLDFRSSVTQQQEATEYEGRAAQVMYENQARASEYQGQLAAWQAGKARTQAIGNMFGSLLGSFGG